MKQKMRTWVNGIENGQISVHDRGLQFGDGVFETMRMIDGRVAFWPEHLSRLQSGCEQLGISLKNSQIEKQLTMIKREFVRGAVKLIVTRGESLRGYKVNNSKQANLIWLCSDLPEYPLQYYSEGVDICFCETTVSCHPKLAGLKHLNRLENVLARMEWQDEYQEGLMLDEQSHIVEGTMSNVFFINDDVLTTPDISCCGVAGVMRKMLLDIAIGEGIKIEVKKVPLFDVEFFDSILLTNSLIGAWPVKNINTQRYKISPLAQHLVEQVMACRN